MEDIHLTFFRTNLKAARFFAQLTAEELSREANLRNLKRVSAIEDGRGKPSLEEAQAICKVLKQPMDSMVNKLAKITIEF